MQKLAYPQLSVGLVGAWRPSAGATGFRLIDRSGRGNHGVLTNMDPATDWVASGGAGALDFDGSNDYVPLSFVPSFGTGSLTFSLWCLLRGGADDHAIKIGTATLNNAAGIYINGNPSLLGRLSFGLHAGTEVVASSAFTLNTWRHVVGVLTPSTLQLYCDGVLEATATAPTYNIGTTFAIIGAAQTGLVPWDGQLDDILIYNRALSPAEIRLLASRRGIAYQRRKRRYAFAQQATGKRRRLLLTGQT